MSKSELIRMAREAGFAINTRTGDINASHGSYNWIISRELERFAALVAAQEREACAQLCDIRETMFKGYKAEGLPALCAAAIRARSKA